MISVYKKAQRNEGKKQRAREKIGDEETCISQNLIESVHELGLYTKTEHKQISQLIRDQLQHV